MKNTKFFLYGLVFLLLLSSCSKIFYVHIRVMEPAPIFVPPHIKKVVVINRTYTPETKQNKAVNILEGALTQEIPFQDRIAAEECVRGLADQLNQLPRFQAQLDTRYKLEGTGTKIFPSPLDWGKIKEICNYYQCDGVISLEMFDSDNIHEINPVRRETTVNGQKQYYTEYVAHLGIKVEAGWRIYDPESRQIIDQNNFIDTRAWDGSGKNQLEAIAKCPPQVEMVKQGGYAAGMQYAYRISPNWVTVTREMYKRGNESFKRAYRLCNTGQWNEAAEACKPYINDPDPKIAGRACHNIAVVAEVNGNLDAAIDWVRKAYVDYGLKRSRDYYNQLMQRKRAEEVLRQQMESK